MAPGDERTRPGLTRPSRSFPFDDPRSDGSYVRSERTSSRLHNVKSVRERLNGRRRRGRRRPADSGAQKTSRPCYPCFRPPGSNSHSRNSLSRHGNPGYIYCHSVLTSDDLLISPSDLSTRYPFSPRWHRDHTFPESTHPDAYAGRSVLERGGLLDLHMTLTLPSITPPERHRQRGPRVDTRRSPLPGTAVSDDCRWGQPEGVHPVSPTVRARGPQCSGDVNTSPSGHTVRPLCRRVLSPTGRSGTDWSIPDDRVVTNRGTRHLETNSLR